MPICLFCFSMSVLNFDLKILGFVRTCLMKIQKYFWKKWKHLNMTFQNLDHGGMWRMVSPDIFPNSCLVRRNFHSNAILRRLDKHMTCSYQHLNNSPTPLENKTRMICMLSSNWWLNMALLHKTIATTREKNSWPIWSKYRDVYIAHKRIKYPRANIRLISLVIR